MIDLSKLMVGEKLGSGGQGQVFFAFTDDRKRFAVKVIAAKPGLDPSARLRSLRADEFGGPLVPVLAQADLNSLPAALRRQLKGIPRDGLLLVMPFVPGATLAQVRETGALSPVEVAAALAGVASKLARLPPGVAHGDLKAANVMVQADGEVSLIDPDLWREPAAGEDLRALGELGKELLGASATGELGVLLEELGHASLPPSASATAGRQADIARSFGAQPGNLGAALIPRVAPVAKEIDAPVVASAPAKPKRKRGRWIAGALAALIVIPFPVNWYFSRLWIRTTVSDNTFINAGPTREYLKAEPGTVHYPEQLHLLSGTEKVAAEDALLKATVVDRDVLRVAIASVDGKELWAVEQPVRGTSYWFDAKEGVYHVLIHRPGEKNPDDQPVKVDKDNWFRFLVTDRAYEAPMPHRPPRRFWFWFKWFTFP